VLSKKDKKRPVMQCCWWNVNLQLPLCICMHHFGNAPVCEWINKSSAVRKAVVGWSSLEAYGKRMNWPVKQASSLTQISTPANHGKSGEIMVNLGGDGQ
jgi:hypothetical protein